MRAVIQRVARAALQVEGEKVGEIGRGFVALVGFREPDGAGEIDWMAQKVLGLRVFPDDAGNMNRALDEVGGGVVVVPNFTLYGDCRKGRRPSFTDAARPEVSSPLYDQFVARLREGGLPVVAGVFGAHMQVELVNDGPVTLVIDREAGAPA
jgi:D-aminoacyl-tRNA deacylase